MYEMANAKSNSENKKVESLLHDERITLAKHDVKNGRLDTGTDRHKNPSDEEEECRNFMGNEASDLSKSNNVYQITIWRKKKWAINKSLFAFRLTQFLWYGAAGLISVFLGIFLKQRGLTLIELSSVYSLVFVFQLIACSITGIITDKIGNAKPVLMFLMLSSTFIVVSMLLTPAINDISCTERQEKSNFSSMLDNIQNFSSCYHCLLKNETHIQKSFAEVFAFANVSIEEFLLILDNSKNGCNFSSTLLKNESSELLEEDCCGVCKINTNDYCMSVRKEYLVAVYAILILAFYAAWNSSFRFINIVAVSLAEKNDSHYGKEYAFANSGNLFTIVIVAFVLNIDKSSGPKIDFEPIFWIAAAIMFSANLTLYVNKVPIMPPGRNLMKKAFSLLKDVDILAFILVVFVSGNAFSFRSVFHLVFLETINAPRIVVTLYSVSNFLYGFPFVLTFQWWIKKFGAHKLLVFGLVCFAIHNAAFSYVFNPWWSLLIDLTIAISDHLFWVTVVVHCWNVAPVGLTATMNALTGWVHFGFGRSSGVFFGGMMMNYLGPRKAYRVMAVILFTAAILYSIFLYIRHKYPKVKVPVNDHATEDTKCSKKMDSQDVEFANKN